MWSFRAKITYADNRHWIALGVHFADGLYELEHILNYENKKNTFWAHRTMNEGGGTALDVRDSDWSVVDMEVGHGNGSRTFNTRGALNGGYGLSASWLSIFDIICISLTPDDHPSQTSRYQKIKMIYLWSASLNHNNLASTMMMMMKPSNFSAM